jgi:hypothetical protein
MHVSCRRPVAAAAAARRLFALSVDVSVHTAATTGRRARAGCDGRAQVATIAPATRVAASRERICSLEHPTLSCNRRRFKIAAGSTVHLQPCGEIHSAHCIACSGSACAQSVSRVESGQPGEEIAIRCDSTADERRRWNDWDDRPTHPPRRCGTRRKCRADHACMDDQRNAHIESECAAA